MYAFRAHDNCHMHGLLLLALPLHCPVRLSQLSKTCDDVERDELRRDLKDVRRRITAIYEVCVRAGFGVCVYS